MVMTDTEREVVETGEWDIDFECGCEAECSIDQGYPIWYLIHLCEEHNPTSAFRTELNVFKKEV